MVIIFFTFYSQKKIELKQALFFFPFGESLIITKRSPIQYLIVFCINII